MIAADASTSDIVVQIAADQLAKKTADNRGEVRARLLSEGKAIAEGRGRADEDGLIQTLAGRVYDKINAYICDVDADSKPAVGAQERQMSRFSFLVRELQRDDNTYKTHITYLPRRAIISARAEI